MGRKGLRSGAALFLSSGEGCGPCLADFGTGRENRERRKSDSYYYHASHSAEGCARIRTIEKEPAQCEGARGQRGLYERRGGRSPKLGKSAVKRRRNFQHRPIIGENPPSHD